MSRHSKRGHGFTLLEMLVVLLLVGAVTAVVGPAVTRGLTVDPLDHFATEVTTTLRRSRLQAIVAQEIRWVRFDLNSRLMLDRSGATTSLPLELQMDVVGVGNRMTPAIGFLPDGSSTGGRIHISDPYRQISIDVHWMSGSISLAYEEASDA